MYQVGQQIVYGMHGVCSIVALEEKKIDKKIVRYYVLAPLDQPITRYYVPAENQAALAKLRQLATKEELNALLSAPLREDIWVPEENRRKQYYRELVASVDLRSMVDMIRYLRHYRRQQLEQGRKFHQCDENFLRDAQRILSTEISIVMQISMAQVKEYLDEVLE